MRRAPAPSATGEQGTLVSVRYPATRTLIVLELVMIRWPLLQ